jgi:L-lactate utilization protein LutC
LSKFESFAQALRLLNGEAYYAATREETEARIRDLMQMSRASRVVVAGLPNAVRNHVLSSLEGREVKEVENLKGREAATTISRADVGITWAAGGLAEEGALMEVTWDDATKLASSLPLTHVALLSERSLLPDLAAGMLEAGRIVKSSASPKPVISFIAGPSKTADIEGKLLHGVHGPHSVFAIVLGWA